MLRFDKLKIATSINYVKKITEKEFEEIHKSGSQFIHRRKYRQTKPYLLDIQINYGYGHKFNPNEIVLEFTSKIFAACGIVGLIDRDNFLRILDIIQPIVAFNDDFNPPEDFEVLKCDVTQDVRNRLPSVSMKELKQYANAHLSNFDKWKCKKHPGNGFTVENTATTSNSKHRIAIYNKGKEIRLAKHHDYVRMINHTVFAKNGSSIEKYFADTIRIELNIDTKKQIRELLHIDNNRISSVLGSGANPILAVLDEALVPVKEPAETGYKTHKERLMCLLIKDCDNDLSKVEAIIRSDYSTNTQIKKIMEPYRNLYEKIQNPDKKEIDIRQLIENNE